MSLAGQSRPFRRGNRAAEARPLAVLYDGRCQSRQGSAPFSQLWQVVVVTGFYRGIGLPLARQLATSHAVAQHYHLADAWQGSPCELQRGLAHGPHRHRLLDKLDEEPRMFGKIVVHGEYKRRL
jgi:hypothetical protein